LEYTKAWADLYELSPTIALVLRIHLRPNFIKRLIYRFVNIK
jgi:hypothetical protein